QGRRGPDPRAVDERAVGRAQVHDLDAVSDAADKDMVPRQELVRAERLAKPGVPAEHPAPGRYRYRPGPAVAGHDDQAQTRVQRHHPGSSSSGQPPTAGVLSSAQSQATARKYTYSTTVPVTQVTVPPPTHTWPSASWVT